jgi:hypothetical protein
MRRLYSKDPSSLLIDEKTIVRHDFLHALSDLNYFRLPNGRWRDDVIRNRADMPEVREAAWDPRELKGNGVDCHLW